MSLISMTCMNCNELLQKESHTFQGVVICHSCFQMVNHFIQRTKNELDMLFLVYTDMLRTALIKGELRPPKAPSNGQNMPPIELSKAFRRAISKCTFGENK